MFGKNRLSNLQQITTTKQKSRYIANKVYISQKYQNK